MIKHVFIDMDNTIAEVITPYFKDYFEGMYYSKRPIKVMIKAINTLFSKQDKYILSVARGNEKGINEKIYWLKKECSILTRENYFIDYDSNNNNEKSDFIIKWCDKYGVNPMECLLIDDKKDTLVKCKDLGIQVMFPLQVICEYENNVNSIKN